MSGELLFNSDAVASVLKNKLNESGTKTSKGVRMISGVGNKISF